MATKVRTYRIDVNSANVGDAIVVGENGAMTAQHLGTAASKDAGTSAGNVPVLNNEGKLPDSTISDDAMKKSIYDPNGKQGNVYDYRNFDNTPDIPEVYDPVITFTQGGVSKGSITLNQAGTATIALDAGGVTAGEAIDITNNVVNAKYDNDTIKLNNNNKLYVDIDDELSSSSKLPVQNKVVQSAISGLSTDIGTVDAKFADYTPTASLSAVALSNNYDDLDDKPYIPDVIDNLLSSETNKALSANQGRILKGMIDDIAAIGNFLSIWNSTTGQPVSFPKTTPYTYHTGDYYLVGAVGDTNYKPAGTSYDGTASSVVESGEVEVGDMYVYDGTVWMLQMNHGKTVSFANLTGDPYDNTALSIALNAKADASSLATVATSGSYTDLSNTPTIPTVNDSTITIQKNSTTVDTFTLNQSSTKTIDISVPTTVVELTDASDYATVASLGAVATSNSYTDLDNKPSIPPFLSAGNGVDITNNYINVDVDNSTIKIDSNTNKLYYNNSAGYITKDVDNLTNYTKSSDLATVATSGAYSDLSGTPSLATVATSGDYTDLTNTPSLAAVATSGAYSDLSGTPSLATVATSGAYSDLTGTPSIPSKTSDLTNDSGFITDSDINTKMFELSSTSDLTTANNILAYVNDGKNPVVKYNNALYILHSKSASQLSFRSGMTIVAGTSDTNISQYTIVFNISNSAVTTISATTSSLGKYLETDRNYSASLTPAYNGSPATKKYVDDGLGGKQDTLLAGTNITIDSDGKTISAIDTTYTAGTGIDITNGVISNTQTSAEWGNITGTLADQTDLKNALDAKQDSLSTQTAYTAKGSATKVPQITTNTLGQVTGITEVTITQPTKTSDLQNDSGFITNAVDNLTNYYKKTETYTQAEVNSLVQNFQGFEVVATLPTTDIKTNVIYLLGPIGSGADKYEEYIYSNSTWIKIGDTSVDLTNYFNRTTNTTDDITEGTNKFVTTAEKNTWSGKQDAISDLATIRSGANAGATALQPNDNVSELNNDSGYLTKTSINTFIIKESDVTVTTSEDMGVAPYNTSYKYTNIDINANAGIEWKEGAIYTFVVDNEMVVASAYRNVRVRIGNGEYIPVMSTTAALAGSSYFTKTNTRQYQYTNKYESGGALHLFTDSNTTYKSMTAAQATAGTATTALLISPTILKGAIEEHAPVQSVNGQTGAVSITIPTKTSDLTNDSGFVTSAALPTKVSDLQNDAGYTTNTGTITSVKMNGITVSSSGEADLGTVITSHQDISGKQDKAFSGSSAPATTPTYVGQQYVDTANDKLYVATGTSSSSDWMEVGAGGGGGTGDMAYADFEWETKTGANVTLDLTSTITPSANFTVNKPSTIKEGQIYILRVTSGSTVYTMSLGSGINNPWNLDLSLNANETAQFVFLAVSSSALELQKPGGGDFEYVTELEYEGLPSSKLTNGVSYFIYG